MEMENTSNLLLRQAERADVKIRGPIIVGILRDGLKDTAFVSDKAFTQEDTSKARLAFLMAAPFAHPKVFPNFWEHCLYNSILARHIAGKVETDQLPPMEAEALAFIHDAGSLAVPHRYYRKDKVGELFDKNIGVRADLLKKQPNLSEILGKGKARKDLSDMTLPQIILEVADNVGKINDDGTARTLEQTISYNQSQPQRYGGGVFPSERFGLRALTLGGKQEFANEILEHEINFLKSQYGIDLEEVIQAAFAEYEQPENQQWLRTVKQAQRAFDTERLTRELEKGGSI